MTKYFSISREKDENELVKEMQIKFHNLIESTNLSLNLVNINQAFTCVETIFINLHNRFDKETIKVIDDDIKEFLRLYQSIRLGGKNDNFEFMADLNSKVKNIYKKVIGGLK